MKTNRFIYITLSLLLLASCKKDFLEVKPLSRLTADNAFVTEDDALKAVVAVYARLQGQRFYGQSYIYLNELPSDDATYNETMPDDIFMDDFTWNSNIGGAEGRLANFWRVIWEGVQRANSVLDNVPAIAMDEGRKKQILAEARFLRAFFYWQLATDFGGVPLFTTVPTGIEDLNRDETPQADVYRFVISELEAIKEDLPERWPADQTGRATKWAVMALLGKTYLYTQDWNNAKAVLGTIVNSSGLRLQKFEDNFSEKTENGPESIFEIQYEGGFLGTQIGIFFIDGGISGENNWRPLALGIKQLNPIEGQVVATKDIFNEFEPLDPRLSATLWQLGDTTLMRQREKGKPSPYNRLYATNVKQTKNAVGQYYNVKKAVSGNFTGTTFEADYGINQVLFRLGDIKLMYAEALAESGDLQGAVVQLNELRRFRRGTAPETVLPDFPYTTRYGGNEVKGDPNSPHKFEGQVVSVAEGFGLREFRVALVHERRVELAFEYHRFNDLKRWARLDAANHPGSAFNVFANKAEPRSLAEDKKTNFNERNLLLPKPLIEVDKSKPYLKQNYDY